MNALEMRQKRAALISEARGLLTRGENGAMGAEDQAQYDKVWAQVEQLGDSIRKLEQLDLESAALAQPLTAPVADMRSNAPEQRDGEPVERRATPEYGKAFDAWLRGGVQGMGATDIRALQADLGASGGYLLAPMQMVNGIIQAMDNAVLIRQLATKFQVPTAQSLGAPSLEADPADATWTAEIATGGEDSTMAFGRRELAPKPLAKRIKVSNKLLRQIPTIDAYVTARLAYKFAVTQETAFMTGTGANQPLGVFTASNDGIPTTRDVATDNTTTAFTVDGLINAKYTLKAAYWPNARWIFHRDGVKMLSKLKDGEGVYIWQPSVQMGQPDMLLGQPILVSEYAPNTFTAGLYVGILGDFSYYWIADALDMQVQRLVELYAETNQTGLIGRMESDAMPVLSEAFVRVTLAP